MFKNKKKLKKKPQHCNYQLRVEKLLTWFILVSLFPSQTPAILTGMCVTFISTVCFTNWYLDVSPLLKIHQLFDLTLQNLQHLLVVSLLLLIFPYFIFKLLLEQSQFFVGNLDRRVQEVSKTNKQKKSKCLFCPLSLERSMKELYSGVSTSMCWLTFLSSASSAEYDSLLLFWTALRFSLITWIFFSKIMLFFSVWVISP